MEMSDQIIGKKDGEIGAVLYPGVDVGAADRADRHRLLSDEVIHHRQVVRGQSQITLMSR